MEQIAVVTPGTTDLPVSLAGNKFDIFTSSRTCSHQNIFLDPCALASKVIGRCVSGCLTFAGVSVGRRDVAVGRTTAPVAAEDVHTLEGTEVPGALGAFIDVCW